MEESHIRYDEINCTKSNGIAQKYDVTTDGSSDVAVAKEREDTVTTEEKKSFLSFSGQPVVWFNAIAIVILHALAVYSFIVYPYSERLLTLFFGWLVGYIGSCGVGVGAHRLWTHRSFKAKTPLKIILLIFYYSSGQNSVYNWVRDHRTHHKYSETDADPYNSSRGFFFSHVGWLMVSRHPEVIKKGRQIDMSDITSDPVVAFGDRYFNAFKIFFCFILPIVIPVYFWNEEWYYAIISQWFMRYALVLNGTWSVNSVAHMFGWRPYDKFIAPTDNILVSYITSGEGWHNYHHTFPWDYKAGELNHKFLDMSTHFIHIAQAIGWAYDLKQPSPDLIRKTIARKGDGSHAEVPLLSE